MGQKNSVYVQQELVDEDLKMMLYPNNMSGSISGHQTIFDYIHPNCIAINNEGRIFVGDSRGHISSWDVNLRHGKIEATNYYKIQHKELEGDEIN